MIKRTDQYFITIGDSPFSIVQTADLNPIHRIDSLATKFESESIMNEFQGDNGLIDEMVAAYNEMNCEYMVKE